MVLKKSSLIWKLFPWFWLKTPFFPDFPDWKKSSKFSLNSLISLIGGNPVILTSCHVQIVTSVTSLTGILSCNSSNMFTLYISFKTSCQEPLNTLCNGKSFYRLVNVVGRGRCLWLVSYSKTSQVTLHRKSPKLTRFADILYADSHRKILFGGFEKFNQRYIPCTLSYSVCNLTIARPDDIWLAQVKINLP